MMFADDLSIDGTAIPTLPFCPDFESELGAFHHGISSESDHSFNDTEMEAMAFLPSMPWELKADPFLPASPSAAAAFAIKREVTTPTKELLNFSAFAAPVAAVAKPVVKKSSPAKKPDQAFTTGTTKQLSRGEKRKILNQRRRDRLCEGYDKLRVLCSAPEKTNTVDTVDLAIATLSNLQAEVAQLKAQLRKREASDALSGPSNKRQRREGTLASPQAWGQLPFAA